MKTKKTLILDSSVAVKWLNKQDENYTEQADKILKDVQGDKSSIIMPELAKCEVGNALLNKKMSLPNTLGSLTTLYSIPIHFVPQSQQQAQNAMQIAHENNVTFYDASFMALAKEKKADLITDNPKHQKKKIQGLRVVPLKEYR
ncbi:type II toxin-antitoxin system VapC family toxin [Candidatus Roizmanbacteria bacterium]|nr:type II toxin-antitoxin system VapC family toxin [Candidatus Roizmanbacteria bacterium]